MERIDLCGSWQGHGKSASGKEEITFTGTVPGCVHTDLMPDHVTPDLYRRDRADTVQWIESWNWNYTKVFNIEQIKDGAVLCFEGLDVYCDVFLNGKHLGYCDDMFIPHRFFVDGILKPGENTLEVYFYSPIQRVEGKKPRRAAFTAERLNTRRIQCTYGWDWVARFVTCGIWRPVYLTFGRELRAESMYIYTRDIDQYSAQIVLETAFVNTADGGNVVCELIDPDGNTVRKIAYYTEEAMHRTYIDLANPALWYPAGYGAQPLYTMRIFVDGRLDLEEKFGIRTVKIMQLPDEAGSVYEKQCLTLKKDSPSADYYDHNEQFSGFILVVNGIKIMCKGANWVPSEPFPSAERDEKITSILELAKESGLNMVRVWGGGIFERAHFYNECDRLGILVTQDFLMACGDYPEDEAWFLEHLQKEAAYAAKTLRNHPSLMWWTGDNENAVCGCDTDRAYSGRKSAYFGIAPMLQKFDSQRQFLPSSPYGGNMYASKTVGTTHNTQYLSFTLAYMEQDDLSDYKEFFSKYLARFVAEEPVMGAVALPSLKKMMEKDDIFGDDDRMWRYHTQSNPELKYELFDYILMFTEKLLGKFKNNEDRYFKLKYIQYEWIRFTFENFRRNQWFNSGIVYWMLDDCWPAAAGWSLIDYYGLPKSGYYSFKRCAKPVMASIQPTEDGLQISVSNNALVNKHIQLRLMLLGEDGSVRTVETVETDAAANQAFAAMVSPVVPKGREVLLCDVSGDDVHDRAFYQSGALDLVPCDVEVIEITADSITLCADAYVHAVELEGEAVFDDNYFSLLPGERRTVAYRPCGTAPITVQGYTLSDVLPPKA